MTTSTIDLGPRIGLIGDAHGNHLFLQEAAIQLADRGCTSLVQLGDFGLVWDRSSQQSLAQQKVHEVLELVGLTMHVVLGNHENYDEIELMDADEHGVRWLTSRIAILPRSGMTVVEAGQRKHSIGWLSGAASVDRSYRTPGLSWWPQEIPSDADCDALLSGAAQAPVDVLLAHEALATPGLVARLAKNAGMWDAADLRYANYAQQEFTGRVLRALVQDSAALVVSGHYHFRHSEEAEMQSPDDRLVPVRQEILDMEWNYGSVAVLEMPGNTARPELDVFGVSQHDAWSRHARLRRACKQHSIREDRLAKALSIEPRVLRLLLDGHLAVPTEVLERAELLAA